MSDPFPPRAAALSPIRCATCYYCQGLVAPWDYSKKCLHPKMKEDNGLSRATRAGRTCPSWKWNFFGLHSAPRNDSPGRLRLRREIERNNP